MTDPAEFSEKHSQLIAEEPASEAVKSFWIACAGLAIFAHVLVMTINSLITSWENAVLDLLIEYGTLQLTWDTVECIRSLASNALTPSVVVACVAPILYWRGPLIHRFVLSVLIAITVLNVSGDMGYYGCNASWREAGMIAACWIALPVLFIWTPIRTRKLRLVVSSGVLLIAFCVSMFHLFEAPENFFYIRWMLLYAAAFGSALVRRNWGRVALHEKCQATLPVETTSTRTLLELMLVTGLACSAASYWSIHGHIGDALLLVGASLLGLFMAMVSIALICIPLEARFRWGMILLRLIVLGCVTAVCFSGNCILTNLLSRSDWGIIDGELWYYLVSGPQFYVIIFGSVVGSFFFLLLTLGIGVWLRWCGWRIEYSKAIDVTQPQSFSELS